MAPVAAGALAFLVNNATEDVCSCDITLICRVDVKDVL